MTHRVIWHKPGCWWPAHVDFTDVADATAFAVRKSVEVGGEVTVHPLPEES